MNYIQDFREKYRAKLAILGAICINLVIGYPYLWGSLAEYVTQYFNLQNNGNLTIGTVQIIFPCLLLISLIGMNIGMAIYKKIGTRKILFYCGVGMFTCILISAFQKSFILFTIFFALSGFFNGIVYMFPIAILIQFYPENKGMITGICMGSYGFSAVILQTICIAIVNPQNLKLNDEKKYPDSVVQQLPNAMIFLALYTLILTSIGSFFLKSKKNLQLRESFALSHQQEQDESIHQCKKVIYALKDQSFWQLTTMLFMSISYGYAMCTNFKSIGQKYHYDDYYLTLVVGNFVAFSNGIFRFIFGFIYDKFGFRFSYNIILIINIFTSLTLEYIAENRILFAIWFLMMGMCEGGQFTIFPAKTVQMFGSLKGPEIYTRVIISTTFSNFFQQLTIKYLNVDGDWPQQIFFIFCGMNVISFILNNIKDPKYNQYQKCNKVQLINNDII